MSFSGGRGAVGWDEVPPEAESIVAPVGPCPSLRETAQRQAAFDSGVVGEGALLHLGVEERLDVHRERLPADSILQVRLREEELLSSAQRRSRPPI